MRPINDPGPFLGHLRPGLGSAEGSLLRGGWKVVVVRWRLQYPLANLNRLLGLEQPKGPQDDPEVKGRLQGLRILCAQKVASRARMVSFGRASAIP